MNVRANFVFSLMMLLLGSSLPAFGDVQSSVRRLLPATVAVQWTSRPESDSTDPADSSTTPEDSTSDADDVLAIPQLPTTEEVESGEVSLSSGTVVAKNGLIVTAHLSREPGDIEVIWLDGRRLPAKVVVDDQRTDIQLLRVEADGLASVDLRQDAVELAQQVVTVTCTDLRERAAGTGIITAMDRPLRGKAADLLQTDIRTGAMSAGSPLGDTNGRVAGIIVGKQSESSTEDGPALVIPSEYAQALLAAFDPSREEVVVLKRGWLGIQLNEDEESVEHPYIVQVFPKSPAQSAKIQKGDKLLTVRGKHPRVASDVVRILGHSQPGEVVDVIVDRDGDNLQLAVRLGEYPESDLYSSDLDLSFVHPHRLLFIGEDGEVQQIEGSDAIDYVFGGPKLGIELNTEDPNAKPLTGEILNLNEWILGIPSDLGTGNGTTIQVKRSDLEKQLGEVSAQVKALTEQVKGLAETIEKLNAKLKD